MLYWVLLGFTRFYWVLLGLFWFYSLKLRFYLNKLGFISFLVDFDRFYRGFTGFSFVLLSLIKLLSE